MIVLGVALATLLGVGAALSFGDRDAGAPDRLGAYRVLYRVEHRAGQAATSWEERVVARPFRGRSATFDARPRVPGAAPQVANLTSDVALYLVQDDGRLQEVAGRVPGLGAGDHALGVVIDAAVGRGLARRVGSSEVLGRRCTTYRLAGPPTGPLQAFGDAGDRDDVCIDDDGLILREEWVIDGGVVLVRTAVEVDTDLGAAIVERALVTDGAERLPATVAVPRVERLGPGDDLDTFLPPPIAPEGFDPATVVRQLVPAQVSNPSVADPGAIEYVSVAWVFTRGPDLVTVEAVTGPPGRPPWPEDPSVRTSIGGLGVAESVLGPDGPELRVDSGEGRWIRVRGTVAPRALSAYAAELEPPLR